MVVYNGTSRYNAPKNLWDLFTMPDLAKQLLAGDYQLIDLQSMPDADIKKKQTLESVLKVI